MWENRCKVAVSGVGFSDITRSAEVPLAAHALQAVNAAVADSGLDLSDIDLFEINEAFALVAMAALEELDLEADRVNVHGGAVALGHPIGASGARILVTLLHAMESRDVHRGVAAICIGGGEASAVVVERS